MQQSGIFVFLIVIAVCVLVLALVMRALRRRATDDTPRLPLAQKAKAIFKSNDPSTRSPAGSMAARREDIEDMLRGKEDLQS